MSLLGICLLLNVSRVAIMSSPVPFVPVCVGGALAGHVILTRRLVSGKYL